VIIYCDVVFTNCFKLTIFTIYFVIWLLFSAVLRRLQCFCHFHREGAHIGKGLVHLICVHIWIQLLHPFLKHRRSIKSQKGFAWAVIHGHAHRQWPSCVIGQNRFSWTPWHGHAPKYWPMYMKFGSHLLLHQVAYTSGLGPRSVHGRQTITT